MTESSASSHAALSSRRTAKEQRRPELEGMTVREFRHEALYHQRLPCAQPPASTHTGPFFSKPCRWAAQEARAARMYRKTLIWAVERWRMRGPDSTVSALPGGPKSLSSP